MTENSMVRSNVRSWKSLGVPAFLFIEALLVFLISRGSQGLISTFVMSTKRGGILIPAPDLVLPTHITLLVISSLIALAGFWQLFKGFRKTNAIIIGAISLGLVAFLVWATRDQSMNLTGMLISTLVRSTPIALAALSGIYSERSGVVNIGIEGMMLMGALGAVVIAAVTKNMLVGVIGGMLFGMLLGWLHAVLSIKYRINQIISGTGVIILALGLTSYLFRAVIDPNPALSNPGPVIAAWPIPVLWKIPVVGPIFFTQSPIIYAMFILIIVTHVLLYKTSWGLRIRAVGEHPRTADTLGINVFTIRYVCVLISGAIAGLSGAYMSIGVAGRFNEGMTAGKGFLGLAAMIFGNWNPGTAYVGALIFGFFDSWQEKLTLLKVGIPGELLGMAPYIATMIILSGFIGRVRMPAADGTPYEKQ